MNETFCLSFLFVWDVSINKNFIHINWLLWTSSQKTIQNGCNGFHVEWGKPKKLEILVSAESLLDAWDTYSVSTNTNVYGTGIIGEHIKYD